jgi:CubicO group peptidase (beta-lactamase class C family)
MVSTADDYLRFGRMLVRRGEIDGRRILKPETAKLMTTDRTTPAQRIFSPVAPDWRNYGFGLGVQVLTKVESNATGSGRVGAFGWAGAFGGWWQGDPAEDMVLLWLQHTLPAPPDPGSLAKGGGMPFMPGLSSAASFQKAVYAALDG